jgi:trans-aconitate 2-methyltransferase
MPWDPERYEQFAEQRYEPFTDLVALIAPRPGLRAVDLGCGTGELTRRLADHLPESDVLGIDESPQMLERASPLARPGLRFAQGKVEDASGEYDVVFSHAALQWVQDHASLVPRLFGMVAAGGRIAIQIPSNFDEPSHVLMVQASREEPFVTALGVWKRTWPVLGIQDYAQILFDAGAEDITVFEKVYPHVVPDADGIVDWMSGTALVPYRERLGVELYGRFVERYRALIRERYPMAPVFFGFRRTLFAATRPG